MKFFILLALSVFIIPGSSGGQKDRVSVSVMEGDSVTLNTDKLITSNQQDRFRWYLNDTRIAQIVGNQSLTCTDDQCKERFRDRLKLDHQTGSPTITNTTNTDSGDYQLQIIISSRFSEKIFSVTVRGVPELDVKRKSVKEGESVTLDPGVTKNTNDVMTWYFKDILIAEITGDQSQICTDAQCEERFRDRLKLDHQTGSLTINNTRTTDSGVYKLEIIISSIGRRRRSISITNVKSFSVSVIAVPGAGLSSGYIPLIVVGVLLVAAAAAAAAAIYYRHPKPYTLTAQDGPQTDIQRGGAGTRHVRDQY